MAGDPSPPLGLEPGRVRLVDYTERWPELYRREEALLRVALGDLALDIQHVGSTAVPGLRAKPILDIAVGIAQLDAALACRAPLAPLGYEYADWANIPDDYVFGKGRARTHLVHVVAHGGTRWNAYLCFRDALRADPALAREYEALKLRLSEQHGERRGDYTAAKASFIQAVVTRAVPFDNSDHKV